jgi:hypothetical protein
MAESFHSKLNKIAGHSHLNISSIIDVLQQIQNDNEIDIARQKAGEPAKKIKKKTRDLDAKISRLKAHISSESISLFEYMDSISKVFHLGL